MHILRRLGVTQEGVTVLELVIILVILAGLVGIVISTSLFATSKVKESRCKMNQKTIEDALNEYYLTEQRYPEDLRELQTIDLIERDFDWKCPDDGSMLYYEHYNREKGTVSCPHHPS